MHNEPYYKGFGSLFLFIIIIPLLIVTGGDTVLNTIHERQKVIGWLSPQKGKMSTPKTLSLCNSLTGGFHRLFTVNRKDGM